MSFRDRYPVAWEFHRNTERRRGAGFPLGSDDLQDPPKELPLAPYVPLPEPRTLPISLSEVIARRLSCRRFAAQPIDVSSLATVLSKAYAFGPPLLIGTMELRERPVPSAGALYPLELYVLARRIESVEPGVYHYAAITHGLEQIRAVELPGRLLTEIFMGQHYVEGAGAVVIIACEPHRSLKKYGDRGYRYALLEAGHVAQNVNLTAAATGLGAFNVGGFFDEDVARLLKVDPEQEVPLYAIAIGVSADGSRAELRTPP